VLVQVPRAGYVPALACGRCRTPARCATCQGPLHVRAAGSAAACAWCGREASWRCPSCGGSAVRAVATGVRRTAEELGRAFPGTPVRLSRGDGVLPAVDASPALIVATPGAEPVAAGGYAAALLLDGQALLARTDLRAAEEALRRWMTAAALVRPGPEGGRVVIIADPAAPAVQALVRWDPAGFAERELADRQQLRFPPAARVAELTGASADLTALLGLVDLPTGSDVLGPAPAGEPDTERVLVRVPRASGAALAAALKAAQGVRAAKRSGGAVRIRIDPADLG
jgi:primosomal protein N' (replication factor Y) (superfamily II helicase)